MVSLVIEIIAEWKKRFIISSVLSSNSKIIKEEEIEVEKWISNVRIIGGRDKQFSQIIFKVVSIYKIRELCDYQEEIIKIK